MNNYEINENTLAVVSVNEKESMIIEKNKQYCVTKSGYDIMDDSCQYFGSSYQGRVAGSKAILNAKYKLPIIVEDSRNLIFFPTESPELVSCSWISLKDVKEVLENGDKTIVLFKNGYELDIDISKFSIENQILRASRLEYILRNRKNISKKG